MAADTPALLDLSGRWRVGIADEDLRRRWYSDEFDDSTFDEIDVPGHWRSAPAFGDNDDPLLYRRRFTTLTPEAGARAWLDLWGVCSQGDVWLDGDYLGNTDGAWVPHRFEVTDALATRNEHTLAVEVTSPPLGDPANKRSLLGTWQDGPYVTPGWNPGGIWRPVTVHRTGAVAVRSHRVLCTAANEQRATVTVRCVLDAARPGDVTIRTTVDGVDDERNQTLAGGENVVTWSVDIDDPDLWWPAGLGDQHLVDVTVEILTPTATGDGATTSDGFTRRCGLRQVALDDWILTVNGERLFVRGVLLPPAAEELGTAPDERFTDQIAAAQHTGCNLVRVHAHISMDALYRAADDTGMLVWQDLPLYRGQHRGVRRTAIATAEAMVDRLGAHPSIILWCAHDEPDAAAIDPQRRTGFLQRLAAHELPNWNRSVLDPSVRRVLTGADPSRPVVGSSGTWPRPPALSGTDTHLELGWSEGHPEDLARIARGIPRAVRFVQITPSPAWATDPDAHDTATWPETDLGVYTAGSTVDTEVLLERFPPEDHRSPGAWQDALRVHQAHLVRTQVETLRRLKYRPTGGFTVAYLHDLRPVMSPSLIDHTGDPKPAHDALGAACADVLVTLSPWPDHLHPGDRVECAVHVVNDRRGALVDAHLDVAVTGRGLAERWEFGGGLEADTVAHIGRIAFTVPPGCTDVHATAELHAGNVRALCHYTAAVHTPGTGDDDTI